jgi:hypothetical protein
VTTDTISTGQLAAAQAALRDYAAVTLDHRIIADGINDEPHLLTIAAEHGWDDPEVTDKLFATICVHLLGITYEDQAARYWSRRAELEDDVQAANDRLASERDTVKEKP